VPVQRIRITSQPSASSCFSACSAPIGHPLHSAYIAKNEAATAWLAEIVSNYSASPPPGSAAKLRSSFL
jgi:hypothetical protein